MSFTFCALDRHIEMRRSVEISAEKGVLTVRGHREGPQQEARDGYRRIERTKLEIAIPKVAQVLAQRITVEAA